MARSFSKKMGKKTSSHIIHSLGGEYCWIVRDSEPIRLLKSPRSLSVYILKEIIACSILRAFVTCHHERRVKRLAGQDVIIAGHCPFTSRYFEPCIVSIIWPFQRLYKPLPYTVLIFCYERTCEILEVTDVRKVAPGLDRVRRLWREIGAKSED